MSREIFREVSCPVCKLQINQSLGVVPVGDRFRQALGDAVEIPAAKVVRCKACGLYYVQPMPFLTTEQYDRLYDEDYFPQNPPRWEERRWRDAERRLGLIADLVGEDGELLDVGCGEGRMLSIARARGWKCRGLETSQPLAKAAEKASGAPVDVGVLESIGYEDSRFAAVYLDSVLEHVPTPAEFASEIARILRVGGAAYIVVPNENGLSSRVLGLVQALRGHNRRLTPFSSPYHWIGFCKRSLADCFRRAHLRPVFVRAMHGRMEIWKHPDRSRSWKWWLLHCLYTTEELIGMGRTLEAMFQKL